MIRTNWHTHTSRCGHACGTDEQYVKAAIRGGLITLGFSDHAAYEEPWPSERMNIEEVPAYIASVRSLQKKYSGKIDIHLGMEVEYYPSQWETLTYYRKEMEYLILGQHQLELGAGSAYGIRDAKRLFQYVDALEGACRHGLCDYIAHPDVVMYSYPAIDGSVREAAQRIAEISVKYDMPLELNCGSGVRYGKQRYQDGERYAYPVRIFFEEFAKRNCPVVIGLDIHDPQLFLTNVYLNRALEVIEGLDCNILEDFDIISAAKKRKQMFY